MHGPGCFESSECFVSDFKEWKKCLAAENLALVAHVISSIIISSKTGDVEVEAGGSL
jgi:hypothetical protein